MDATAIKAMMSEIAPVIREYVAGETAPLLERNAALEARIAELEVQLPVAAPLSVDEVRAIVGERGPEIIALTERVGELENPEVVASAVREATAPLLERIDALEKRELPAVLKGDPGEPGQPGEPGAPGEVDMDAVKALVDQAVSTIPPAEKGEPGRDVDMDEVATRIETAVKSAVSALPAPKDGEPGKDGVGLADALRDAEGNLVLVLADGRTKCLGKIDGKDGEAGRDGLGFDDLNVEQIGERTVRFLLKRGADEAEFDLTLPVPIYRGVFKDGGEYTAGDLTTWGGSLWHCNEPKGLKPGAPESGWQLAAKAGRPGKDAGK